MMVYAQSGMKFHLEEKMVVKFYTWANSKWFWCDFNFFTLGFYRPQYVIYNIYNLKNIRHFFKIDYIILLNNHMQ